DLPDTYPDRVIQIEVKPGQKLGDIAIPEARVEAIPSLKRYTAMIVLESYEPLIAGLNKNSPPGEKKGTSLLPASSKIQDLTDKFHDPHYQPLVQAPAEPVQSSLPAKPVEKPAEKILPTVVAGR